MNYIITALGCKVNQYEAQAVETMLRARGFSPAPPDGQADLIVVNTCAVTAEGGESHARPSGDCATSIPAHSWPFAAAGHS